MSFIEDDPDWQYGQYEPDEEDEWGCLFPGECCMPGEHQKSECYTAEHALEMDIEAKERELQELKAQLDRLRSHKG